MISLLRILVLGLCVSFPGARAAEIFRVYLGTNVVKVATPAGCAEAGAEHRKLFPEASTSALLAWFVRTNDLALFQANATNFFREHYQVQSPKDWVNKRMSDATFKQLVQMTAKDQEGRPPVAEEARRLFGNTTGDTNRVEIAIADPKPLGPIFKSEHTYAYLTLMGYMIKAPQGPKYIPMVRGTAITHVGSKTVYLYYFKAMEERNLLKYADAVKQALEPWVRDTLAANGISEKFERLESIATR
jgi:hypothetical protein